VKRILIIFAALTLAVPARAEVTGADAVARDIEWQVKNLGDDSAVLRDLALQKLARYGMMASDALVRALTTAPPRALPQVRELLTRLPLISPDDSPEVAKALAKLQPVAGQQPPGNRLPADVPADREIRARVAASHRLRTERIRRVAVGGPDATVGVEVP